MELHEEAGFHPIKVVQHATGNNASILGMEGQLGGVRPGYLADPIVVNGNARDTAIHAENCRDSIDTSTVLNLTARLRRPRPFQRSRPWKSCRRVLRSS